MRHRRSPQDKPPHEDRAEAGPASPRPRLDRKTFLKQQRAAKAARRKRRAEITPITYDPRDERPRNDPGRDRPPQGPRIEVLVERYDEEGAARGKAEGKDRPVVIAAGAVPGDRVLVGLDHDARHTLFGRVLRVIEPSKDRVAPRCTVVARCGGCPWQAASYEAQLRWKREALQALVRAVPALAGVPVAAPVALAAPYGYRTKIQMPVGGRTGALEVGFYRAGSKDLVPAPPGGCPVQHPEGNRVVREAIAVLDEARVEPYDSWRHKGTLRYLLLRVDGRPASGTGSGSGTTAARTALTLVVRDARTPGLKAIAERLSKIAGVTGVHVNEQNARGNVVLGKKTVRAAGRDRLLLEVAGKRFLLSPTAFFQTSAEGAAALVERARAHLPGRYRTLVDLYCGVGLFARTLADRADEVLGVEESRAAIDDAKAGAALDETGNVSFLAAPAERWAREAGPVDACVVDPPRRGLEPSLIDAIALRLRPKALVYVSCSPETLVRDLGLLAQRGYRTTAIDPVDMFPHTAHLECVAALERVRS